MLLYIDMKCMIGMSEDGQHVFKLDFPTLLNIKAICKEIDRYNNPDDFVRESLMTFITWWQNPERTPEIIADMWKDMTPAMKNQLKETSPDYYQSIEKLSSGEVNRENGHITKEEHHQTEQQQRQGVYTEESDMMMMMSPSAQQQQQQVLSSKRDQKHAQITPGERGSSERFVSSRKEIMEAIRTRMFPKPYDALPYDGYPLIWSFYTRFLPVKITLSVLAFLIQEYNKEYITFADFADKAYDVACIYARRLKRYESENQTARNRRISTGLPLVEMQSETNNRERRLSEPRIAKKIESSRERFILHYAGMSEKAWKRRLQNDPSKKFFDGALNAMGLISVIDDQDDEFKVTLTDLGAEFVSIENPVLDEGSYTKAISANEKEFILKKIIPQFKLEEDLVRHITSIIDNTFVDTVRGASNSRPMQRIDNDTLESVFKKVISKFMEKNPGNSEISRILEHNSNHVESITAVRVATMGRLSEIGAIEWRMDKHGKSLYERPSSSYV